MARSWPWLALVAGTLAAFVTAAQPWWQVRHAGGAVPIPGNDAAAGLPTALAAVLASGLLLALTLRGWGRRVLGVLLVLVAVAAVVLGVVAPHPPDEVVARLVQAVTLDATEAPQRAWGGYGFAAAGAVSLAGAVGLVLGVARRRAVQGDRFDRAARVGTVAADDDALTVWRALDAGQDPTDDHEVTPISPALPGRGTMAHEDTDNRTERHGRQR